MPATMPPDLPNALLTLLPRLDVEMRRATPDPAVVSAVNAQLDRLDPAMVERVYAAFRRLSDQVDWVQVSPNPAPKRGFVDWIFGVRPAPRPSTGGWRPKTTWPRPDNVAAVLAAAPTAAPLLIFDRDGRVREIALKHIQTASSPFALTAIAYRLNDWVREVRQAARSCVSRTFEAAPVETVAGAALFLMERKFRWRRGKDDVAVLDEVFALPGIPAALAHLVIDSRSGLASRAFKHALTTPLLDNRIAQIASTAVNPATRAMAFQVLIEAEVRRLVGYERRWIDKAYNLTRRTPLFETRTTARTLPIEDAIRLASRDSAAAVRRVAAESLVRHRHELANISALLEPLRDDPSNAVRQRIAFIVDNLGLELHSASGSKAP